MHHAAGAAPSFPGCRESRGAMVLNGDEEVLRLHVVFLVL